MSRRHREDQTRALLGLHLREELVQPTRDQLVHPPGGVTWKGVRGERQQALARGLDLGSQFSLLRSQLLLDLPRYQRVVQQLAR